MRGCGRPSATASSTRSTGRRPAVRKPATSASTCSAEHRWVDLKRVSRYRLSKPKPTIPLLTVVHKGDDYRLTVEFLPDPWRDVLLMRYELDGPYRLGIIAAPHLGSTGHDNTAWVGEGALYAGIADRGFCLTADVPMADLSAGYVGASDGWQDLAQHGRFTWAFARAERGNVALSASLADPAGVIAVGFGPDAASARRLARAALAEGYGPIRRDFIDGWERWGSGLTLPPSPDPGLRKRRRCRRRCSRCTRTVPIPARWSPA